MNTLRLIGIGNPDCGDDGAGPAVIDALAADPPPDGALACVRGDMIALLECWSPGDRVFLIDAMAADGRPGRITRLDARHAAVTGELASCASSHAFNLAEALELGRALARLPAALVVYAIEGACFTPGAALHPAVAAAVPEVARRVREECAPCTKRR